MGNLSCDRYYVTSECTAPTATNSQHQCSKQEISKSNFSATHHLFISPSAHHLQNHAGYQWHETKNRKIKDLYHVECEMEIKSSPNHL